MTVRPPSREKERERTTDATSPARRDYTAAERVGVNIHARARLVFGPPLYFFPGGNIISLGIIEGVYCVDTRCIH